MMKKNIEIPANKAVVFFDGVCNLCNAWVRFVIKRDRNRYFLFASLQSEAAKYVLKEAPIPSTGTLHSIVLFENQKYYTASTALLRIARRLNGGWKMLFVFMIIPKYFRDCVYFFVAKNRYRWFGKKTDCSLNASKDRTLFL